MQKKKKTLSAKKNHENFAVVVPQTTQYLVI